MFNMIETIIKNIPTGGWMPLLIVAVYANARWHQQGRRDDYKWVKDSDAREIVYILRGIFVVLEAILFCLLVIAFYAAYI